MSTMVQPASAAAPAAAATRPVPTRRRRRRIGAAGITRVVVIAAFVLASVLPFYYMVLLSMRPTAALLRDPGAMWIGADEFTFETFINVLRPVSAGGQGFGSFLLNSGIVAISSVILALLIAIPGSYAVARLPFFGRRQISALFLAAYLFPAIVIAIPLFVMLTRMGLRGSLVGLIIVYAAQTVPVAIYMMRNYFETVPVSIEEAAMVDGLTRFGVMRKITIPLSLPSILSTGIFVFMIAWNEFLFALLFLVDRRPSWTVSLGLSRLAGSIEIPTTVLMAGSVILTIPVIVLFFATEKFLKGGLTSGGVKG